MPASSNPTQPIENKPPAKLFTFQSGGWVLLIAVILTLAAAALVLYPVYTTGFHRSIGDGRNPDTYGFDLSKLTIPREQLVASGYAKDEIHAVPEKLVETDVPEAIEQIVRNEHIRFLIPSDLVVGIALNGITRAYPVRILNIHEVVNDRIGDTPFAVSWSPLCGSALVFDRRINGKELEFGVSGLLYQSNLILFDRRSDPKQESLWPQLALHAIAGPATGKRAALIHSEVMTWEDWTRLHPDTRVWLGLRTLKLQYGDAQDPINMYLRTDELKFGVDPYWNDPKVPRKTRIEVTTTDFEHFVAALPAAPATTPATAPSAAPAPFRISTFVFAWYAQHPDDTNYAALK